MATSSSPPTWLEKDHFSHFEVFSGNGSIQKSMDAEVMGFPPTKAATRPQRPGRCLLGPLSFWSGLVSFFFVKESRIYLRDFEHVPPFRSTHPLTEFTKAGFSFSRQGTLLPLPRRNASLYSIRTGQRRLDRRQVLQALRSCSQHPGITGSCPSLIYFWNVSSPSDMSCSFFLSPVNFFSYRHISLLLTNNQSDWFDSWYDQVWRSRILSQCSEGMGETGIFLFFWKKNKLTIWSTCHCQGWQT